MQYHGKISGFGKNPGAFSVEHMLRVLKYQIHIDDNYLRICPKEVQGGMPRLLSYDPVHFYIRGTLLYTVRRY